MGDLSIRDIQIGQYDAIKHKDLINAVEHIKSNVNDISTDLNTYKSDINLSLSSIQQSISESLDIDMAKYTIDNILDIVEVNRIKSSVDQIEALIKQITSEANDLLLYKFTDGTDLLDDNNYSITTYKYLPIGPNSPVYKKIAGSNAGARTALKTYSYQLYLNSDRESWKVVDTVWKHFHTCVDNLITTDTDTTTSVIEIDSELLEQYYVMLNILNLHITEFNNVISISKKRIQELSAVKLQNVLDSVKAELQNDIDEATVSIGNAINSLDNFKNTIESSLEDGILTQVEINRINDLQESLKNTVRQARDEADDLLSATYYDGTQYINLVDDNVYTFQQISIDTSKSDDSILLWDLKKSSSQGTRSALIEAVNLLCKLDSKNQITEDINTIWTNFNKCVELLCNDTTVSDSLHDNYSIMYTLLLNILTHLSSITNTARIRMLEIYNQILNESVSTRLSSLQERINQDIVEANNAISSLLVSVSDMINSGINDAIIDDYITFAEALAIRQQKDVLELLVVQAKDEVDDLLSQVYIDDTSLLLNIGNYEKLQCKKDPNYNTYNPNYVIKIDSTPGSNIGLRSALLNRLDILYNADNPSDGSTIWNYYALTIDTLIKDATEDSSVKVDLDVLAMYKANQSVFMSHIRELNDLIIQSNTAIQEQYNIKQRLWIDSSLSDISYKIENSILDISSALYNAIIDISTLNSSILNFSSDNVFDIAEKAAILQQQDAIKAQIVTLYNEGHNLLNQVYYFSNDTSSNLLDNDVWPEQFNHYTYSIDPSYNDMVTEDEFIDLPNYALMVDNIQYEVQGIRNAIVDTINTLYNPNNTTADPDNIIIWNYYNKCVDALINTDTDGNADNGTTVDKSLLSMWHKTNEILQSHISYINELIPKANLAIQAKYNLIYLSLIDDLSTYFNNIGSDNVVDRIEKASLRNTFLDISTNYHQGIKILDDYVRNGIVTVQIQQTDPKILNVTDKFNFLTNYLINDISINDNIDTSVNNSSLLDNFVNYYNAKSIFDTYLSELYSAHITAEFAVDPTSLFAADISTLRSNNAYLQQQIIDASNRILNMSDDNVISVVEKINLRSLYNNIKVNHDIDVALAELYKLENTSVYINDDSCWNELTSTLLNDCLLNDDTDTVIGADGRTKFNNAFNNYYIANCSLDSSINDAKDTNESYRVSMIIAADISNYFDGRIDTIDASNRALQALIDDTSLRIKDMVKDGVISPQEKRQITTLFDLITINHTNDNIIANTLGLSGTVVVSNENTAYNNLSTYLYNDISISQIMTSTSVEDTSIYVNKLEEYYIANASLDSSIDEIKAKIEAELNASILADISTLSSSLYLIDASNRELQERINSNDAIIRNFGDDNKLTYMEKLSLRASWVDISINHHNDITLANAYGIVSSNAVITNENTAFNALSNYIDTLSLDSSVTTNINRNEYISKFNNYKLANDKLDASINEAKAILEANAAVDNILFGGINLLDEYSDLGYIGKEYTIYINKSDNAECEYELDDEWTVLGDKSDKDNMVFQLDINPGTNEILVISGGAYDIELEYEIFNNYRSYIVFDTKTNKTENTYYTISFDYQCADTTDIWIALMNKNSNDMFYDDGGMEIADLINTTKIKLEPYSTYNRITYTIFNGEDTTELYFKMCLSQNSVVNIKNIKIEEGNIPTAYTKAPSLTQREVTAAAKAALNASIAQLSQDISNGLQSQAYLSSAIGQETETRGGLILTSILELRNGDKQVVGGLSGMEYVKTPDGKYYNKTTGAITNTSSNAAYDDTLLWAGGDYSKAWDALKGNTILPIRLTKQGIGSNIGPFFVESSTAISVKTSDGSILIDSNGNINMYNSNNVCKVGIHQGKDISTDYLVTRKYYAAPDLYDFMYAPYEPVYYLGYSRRVCDENETFTVPNNVSIGDYVYSYTPTNRFKIRLCTPFEEFFPSKTPSLVPDISIRMLNVKKIVGLDVVGAYDVLLDVTECNSTILSKFNTNSYGSYVTNTNNASVGPFASDGNSYTYNSSVSLLKNMSSEKITKLFVYSKNANDSNIAVDIIYSNFKVSVAPTSDSIGNDKKLSNMKYYTWSSASFSSPASGITLDPITGDLINGNSKINPTSHSIQDSSALNYRYANPNITLEDEAYINPSTAIILYDADIFIYNKGTQSQFGIYENTTTPDYVYMYDSSNLKETKFLHVNLKPGHSYRRAWGISVASNCINARNSTSALVWSNDYQVISDGTFVRKELINSINIYQNGIISMGKDATSVFQIDTDNDNGPLSMYISGLPSIDDIINRSRTYNTAGNITTETKYKDVSIGWRPGMVYVDNDNLKVYGGSQISKPFQYGSAYSRPVYRLYNTSTASVQLGSGGADQDILIPGTDF